MKGRNLLPSIIDSLVDSVQRFGFSLNEKKLDSELDLLMLRMDNVQVDMESEEEWEDLQSNYSKLKYLYELINFYNLPTEGKFINSLEKFMEKIDKKTQHYLREIDWTDSHPELRTRSMMIKDLFEESLSLNDPVLKLKSVLNAYHIFVPIVEEIRDEKHESIIETEFFDEFEPSIKRRKKN